MESEEGDRAGVDLLLTKPVTLHAIREALAKVFVHNPGRQIDIDT
jgi:hypothetical protein